MKVFSLFFVKPLNLPGVANNKQQLSVNPAMQGSIQGQAQHCIRGEGGYFVYFPTGVNKGWHHIPDAFVQSVRCEPPSYLLDTADLHLNGTPITKEEREEQRKKWSAETAALLVAGPGLAAWAAPSVNELVRGVEIKDGVANVVESVPELANGPVSKTGVDVDNAGSSPAALAAVPASATPSPNKPAFTPAPCSKCAADPDHAGECDPLVKQTVSFSEAVEAVPAMMKRIAEEDDFPARNAAWPFTEPQIEAPIAVRAVQVDTPNGPVVQIAPTTSGAPKTKKSNKPARA